MLLLLSACLLYIITEARKKKNEGDYKYWAGLAAVFLFLSVDEAASIHELLIDPIRATLHTSGVLYISWVIPYAIILLVLTLLYAKFVFLRIPRRIRNQFIISGIIYVTGALGFELIGGHLFEMHLQESLLYEIITIFEESLEMTGLLVFIHALMLYIRSHLRSLSIVIEESSTD